MKKLNLMVGLFLFLRLACSKQMSQSWPSALSPGRPKACHQTFVTALSRTSLLNQPSKCSIITYNFLKPYLSLVVIALTKLDNIGIGISILNNYDRISFVVGRHCAGQ